MESIVSWKYDHTITIKRAKSSEKSISRIVYRFSEKKEGPITSLLQNVMLLANFNIGVWKGSAGLIRMEGITSMD